MTPGRVSPPKRPGRISAKVFDVAVDLERLQRQGDRVERRLSHAQSAPDRGPTPSLADWNPVDGDAVRPPAIRFRLWLRFVLGPEERLAWETWTASDAQARDIWVERFAIAMIRGRLDELIDDLRGHIAAIAPVPGATHPTKTGLRPRGPDRDP